MMRASRHEEELLETPTVVYPLHCMVRPGVTYPGWSIALSRLSTTGPLAEKPMALSIDSNRCLPRGTSWGPRSASD